MTAFLHGIESNKKIIFSKSKIRNKNPRHLFLDFLLLFDIAVETFGKKNNLVKFELSKVIFLSPEHPDFGSKF